MPSHRSIGDIGEEIAVTYLIQHDYIILERNYQIKGGELDIIAIKGGRYIFIEVKYRRNDDYGHPLDTFSQNKRRVLKRTIMFYLSKHKIDPEDIRIDFIGIMPRKHSTEYDIWHMEGIEV